MDYSKLTKSQLIAIIENYENESLEKSRDLFISNISHDVRTLLNAIYGNAQILQNDKTLIEIQQKSVKRIIDASSNMIDLINNIINISINNGNDKIVIYEFSLNELLKNIYSIFNTTTQLKDISLKLDVSFDENYIIKTDKSKLFYILLNLVGNALKYTNDGYITIRCKLSNNKKNILFEIIDTGIGIEPEMINEITKKYNRGNAKSQIEGYGLGLGIVIKNLNLLNSKLNIESKFKKGSTFSFEIENSKESITFESTKTDILHMQEIQTIEEPNDFKILVYVTNEDEISILSMYFNSRNIIFKLISTLEELKEELKLDIYSMVFLELSKLKKEDMNFLREYKQNYKNLPIVTLTSSVMSSELEIINSISTTYIVEPYSFLDIDQVLILFTNQVFNYKEEKKEIKTTKIIINNDIKNELIKESNLGNYKACSSLIERIEDLNIKTLLQTYLEEYDFDNIEMILNGAKDENI
jgi:hypothetical protein